MRLYSLLCTCGITHEKLTDLWQPVTCVRLHLLPFATSSLRHLFPSQSFSLAEKGWERVAAAKLEADYVKKEMADTLFFSDPLNHRKAAP